MEQEPFLMQAKIILNNYILNPWVGRSWATINLRGSDLSTFSFDYVPVVKFVSRKTARNRLGLTNDDVRRRKISTVHFCARYVCTNNVDKIRIEAVEVATGCRIAL